jgi:Family of unknown function (DUF5701)
VEDGLRHEFDRQLENLLAKGYPKLARMTADAFVEQVTQLEQRLAEIPATANGSSIPFVLVVRNDLVRTERAMSQVEVGQKRGVVRMTPTEPSEYAPIDGLDLPSVLAYLVVDLDIGQTTLNVTPEDALKTILAHRRSPLTIDEGVAVVTHHPDVLRTRNAFSLLGSRRGDRRVPAIWTSSGAPRLGWCWAGNPHTWLGSASCSARLG